jgi:formylglycine-generating enzyme required for sulfatase activity
VRVDLYDARGVRFETRELPTPSALDWPLSFSVVSDSDSEARTILARVRGFPEGHTEPSTTPIAAVPDGGWREPRSYDSLAEACANAPTVTLGETVTLRRGPLPVTTLAPFASPAGPRCAGGVRSGSTAVRVEIAATDTYDLSLVARVPDGARFAGGRTALSVRADCMQVGSQLACDDEASPKLTVALDPGTYWLVTAGTDETVADLSLRVGRQNAITSSAPPDAGASGDAGAAEEQVPAHGVTIDRLVSLRLEPGKRGAVEVPLRADCYGVAADLAGRRACLEGGALEAVIDVVPDGPVSRATTGGPALGSWPAEVPAPCTVPPRPAGPLLDEERCIPGGVFILGDTLALSDGVTRARPERMRVVAPFLMDVFEVSVGRYRDALRRGFVPPAPPTVQNAPLAVGAVCTFNQAAGSLEPAPGLAREAFPLTCVSWSTARELCRFFGGDLPAEDQWEYAATAAGKARETSYPGGDAVPTCDDAVIGRVVTGVLSNDRCAARFGPTAVDDPGWASADRTPLGIVGLAGNVQEWLGDAFLPYDHAAWEAAGLRAPLAWQERAPLRSKRGSSWQDSIELATGSTRIADSPALAFGNVGFRCVRAGR